MSRFLGEEWLDFDQAGHQLMVNLGLTTTFAKWVYWSQNPVGNAICEFINALAEAGLIEKDEDECRFRWKPGYDPSKFGEVCPHEPIRCSLGRPSGGTQDGSSVQAETGPAG